MKSGTRMRVALGVLGVAGFVAVLWLLPTREWLAAIVGWARDAGPLGALAYGALYVVATVLMIPASVLTLGAGFVYGPLYGTLLVSPASVLGASLAFALGRFVVRDKVARRVTAKPRFAAIDRAIGEAGFKIVLLLRLSPVFPFTVLNYALGLTRISFKSYGVASFVGMLPGTILYVYLGSLITSLSGLESGGGAAESGGSARQIFYWAGLAATVVATVLITRIARRALREALGENAGAGAQS